MRRTILRLALVLCVSLCVSATASSAQAETIYARDIDKILQIAGSYGPAELVDQSAAAPIIRGEMDGVVYLITFYGCAEVGQSCTDVQFAALWDAGADLSPTGPDLPRVNEWNRDRRFGNAYIDVDGVVILKMEMNIEHGAERGTVVSTFEWWRLALRNFSTFYFR